VVLELREPPSGLEHEIVDLADARAAEAAVARVAERHGSLSGVVTAAAIACPGSSTTSSPPSGTASWPST